jgi:hypothetical protein
MLPSEPLLLLPEEKHMIVFVNKYNFHMFQEELMFARKLCMLVFWHTKTPTSGIRRHSASEIKRFAYSYSHEKIFRPGWDPWAGPWQPPAETVGPCRQYIYIYMGPQSFPGL